MNRNPIMLKTAALTAAALLAAAAGAIAQTPIYAPQPAVAESFPTLAPAQLDTLVGAIALYPDALVAQILPAATYPVDIVKAARLVRSGATPDQIDQQDWDPSVKAIARYQSVIELLDQNLDWTQQLGQAFIAQPDDVMQAVQRLRLQAQNVGNLVSTPQQQVYAENSVIRIVPTQPDIIYVPVYDPTIVYYTPPVYTTSYISFGLGLPCGSWFDLDIDWINYSCYRPGWTWNHWNDNFYVDRGRFIRPRRDFEPLRGDRPNTVWHRDDQRPLTFPGHRLTRPSQFDGFRGRDNDRDHRPTPQIVHTPRPDRGWNNRPNRVTPGAPEVNRPRDRGDDRRPESTPGPRATPAPRTPAPNPSRDTHRDPGQTVRPAPAATQPNRPAGDTHREPSQTVPRAATPNPAPARVSPPPVHIAPPPAPKPSPAPAYVRPSPAPAANPAPARDGGKPSTGGGGGNRGGDSGNRVGGQGRGGKDQGKH